MAHRPVIDVATEDVAGLAAAKGQVNELALPEEEVGADWKTAALEFKTIIEKPLRVVELGQAQNISPAENFIGQLQGRNACLGIQIVAEAVDQREADRAPLDAGELRQIELGLKPQLTSVGCAVLGSARHVGDGFVTQR